MFKEGDHVLVEINGVDVPAVVEDVSTDGKWLDFDINTLGGSVGIEVQFIKHDPAKHEWSVGDTVSNVDEAKTLPVDTLFKDSVIDVGQIMSTYAIQFVGIENVYSWDNNSASSYFPWTILWVPND